ncbi:hypothetical protein SS50377_24209 [Spironucleus salmonicida]|uniref:Uncharacterized protein n=1 Tax=Spironucleus salmonicida TaxID=348837 RepID=V6LUC9_9EUKA|nr:hypothetical protein SS50377_24209 [Spironucleus salmonicida]|eukprot:EST47868.1 Hypothetical protein SS50377_12059 [Spironucleus salmonicida]
MENVFLLCWDSQELALRSLIHHSVFLVFPALVFQLAVHVFTYLLGFYVTVMEINTTPELNAKEINVVHVYQKQCQWIENANIGVIPAQIARQDFSVGQKWHAKHVIQILSAIVTVWSTVYNAIMHNAKSVYMGGNSMMKMNARFVQMVLRQFKQFVLPNKNRKIIFYSQQICVECYLQYQLYQSVQLVSYFTISNALSISHSNTTWEYDITVDLLN